MYQHTLQEYAELVVAEHKKTIVYTSTDMVMKHGDFVDLCQSVVDTNIVPVIEHALFQEKKMARVSSEDGYDVVKFVSVGHRGEITVSELDIGIVR